MVVGSKLRLRSRPPLVARPRHAFARLQGIEPSAEHATHVQSTKPILGLDTSLLPRLRGDRDTVAKATLAGAAS